MYIMWSSHIPTLATSSVLILQKYRSFFDWQFFYQWILLVLLQKSYNFHDYCSLSIAESLLIIYMYCVWVCSFFFKWRNGSATPFWWHSCRQCVHCLLETQDWWQEELYTRRVLNKFCDFFLIEICWV